VGLCRSTGISFIYHMNMRAKWRDYGLRFSGLVAGDERVARFLRRHQFPSVAEGPCRMVAEGLKQALGEGEIAGCCTWRGRWVATHVVLRVNRNTLLDALGAHTPEDALGPGRILLRWDEDFERPLSWCEAGVELFTELALKAKIK